MNKNMILTDRMREAAWSCEKQGIGGREAQALLDGIAEIDTLRDLLFSQMAGQIVQEAFWDDNGD